MAYSFLKESIESVLLFVTAPIYFTVIGVLQSKNLTIIKKLKKKNLVEQEKFMLLRNMRMIKRLSPALLLFVAIIHAILYLIFAQNAFRNDYFISIAIMYFIYLFITMINFYLKGASILKDIGNFNGLPGN